MNQPLRTEVMARNQQLRRLPFKENCASKVPVKLVKHFTKHLSNFNFDFALCCWWSGVTEHFSPNISTCDQKAPVQSTRRCGVRKKRHIDENKQEIWRNVFELVKPWSNSSNISHNNENQIKLRPTQTNTCYETKQGGQTSPPLNQTFVFKMFGKMPYLLTGA